MNNSIISGFHEINDEELLSIDGGVAIEIAIGISIAIVAAGFSLASVVYQAAKDAGANAARRDLEEMNSWTTQRPYKGALL